MGDEPVGDDVDEDVSVTATMSKSQLDQLEAMFPDARSDPERLRRAVWMVTNASSITFDHSANENKTE